MRTALIFVDYGLDECNSVSEIELRLSEELQNNKYRVILAKADSFVNEYCGRKLIHGFPFLYSEKKEISYILSSREYPISEKIIWILSKVILFLVMHGMRALKMKGAINRINNNLNVMFHDKVIKKVEPDVVLYLTYLPKSTYINLCKSKGIPYIHVLYDTYISRPGIDHKIALSEETKIIDGSIAYFVPSFFLNEYFNNYSKKEYHQKIKQYDLPLLIRKNIVMRAFSNVNSRVVHPFSYFGQMQSFRNVESIKSLLMNIGVRLDVFSSSEYVCDECFVRHSPVINSELWEAVARSKILVIFDNGFPYQHYLPSKCYLYVSFTKPILAIGDNNDSAVIEFFKNYPYFYYHKLGDPIDGLLSFIQQEYPLAFNEGLYDGYEKYLPENSLRPIMDAINSI